MPRVLIIADDLSGAADCGIACVHAGLNATVSLGSTNHTDADVLSIDAHTRVLHPQAAAERIHELVCQYANDPSILLFKKIDSTLRGHLGAELAAALDARRRTVPNSIAIMAPAFPANGRTTVRGMHYVHGVPLHETEMWKREDARGEANIAAMMEGSGLRCKLLDLAVVRESRSSLHTIMERIAETADVLICDSETVSDLSAVASAASAFGNRALWVGSAGLAQYISGAAEPHTEDATEVALPQTSGTVLFVIGSASRRTKHQAAILLSSAAVRGIVVPPEVLLAGSTYPEWTAFTRELNDAVAQGDDVILLCGSEPEVQPELRPKLSEALGEMTAGLSGKVGALVASGGETARKVLDGWGVQEMKLHGELEKGVPISTAKINGSRPLTIITKAGDFGQPYTLLHCRAWLTQTRIS
jgi:4-hydroxythreonine-4-phosphate dehydrogenase